MQTSVINLTKITGRLEVVDIPDSSGNKIVYLNDIPINELIKDYNGRLAILFIDGGAPNAYNTQTSQG